MRVFYPAISLDSNQDPHQFITKIDPGRVQREYDNYQLLRSYSADWFPDPFQVYLVNTPCGRGLNVPYIPGPTLDQFLNQYLTVENTTNRWMSCEGKNYIPLEVWNSLLEQLSHLQTVMMMFNDHGFYHGDLNSTNIIITPNGMKVIDFYSLEYTFEGHQRDLSDVRYLIKDVTQDGLLNPEIAALHPQYSVKGNTPRDRAMYIIKNLL